MKLCITCQGTALESKVDERFGRAPYFLIVDRETKEFHAVRNAALTAAVAARQGAGGRRCRQRCRVGGHRDAGGSACRASCGIGC